MSIFYKIKSNPVTYKFVQRIYSYRKNYAKNNAKIMLLQVYPDYYDLK